MKKNLLGDDLKNSNVNLSYFASSCSPVVEKVFWQSSYIYCRQAAGIWADFKPTLSWILWPPSSRMRDRKNQRINRETDRLKWIYRKLPSFYKIFCGFLFVWFKKSFVVLIHESGHKGIWVPTRKPELTWTWISSDDSEMSLHYRN